MPYPVGSSYGRDTQFNPAVPADVPGHGHACIRTPIPRSVKTLSYAGKATAAGLFGAAQGMKSFPLDAPGEYHAQVLATYTDAEGHLWVSTMRHAGVVYARAVAASSRAARSSPSAASTSIAARRSSRATSRPDGESAPRPHHVPLPRRRRAAHRRRGTGRQQDRAGADVPDAGRQRRRGTRSLNGVGTTNLRIKTSNGYSPHLYPEYITDDGVLLRRRAAAGLHGALPRRREQRARAVLARQPEQLRRTDRRVAQRRRARRHLPPARRRGAAPRRAGPDVRGLHRERVPAGRRARTTTAWSRRARRI